MKNYSNQDVLIKGHIHSNNYSNNNNNDNSNNNNNNFNDNSNSDDVWGSGVGKVELNSSAYHRKPCPPESGVAPLSSASN